MKRSEQFFIARSDRHRQLWRGVVIAVATLILCSCRAVDSPTEVPAPGSAAVTAALASSPSPYPGTNVTATNVATANQAAYPPGAPQAAADARRPGGPTLSIADESSVPPSPAPSGVVPVAFHEHLHQCPHCAPSRNPSHILDAANAPPHVGGWIPPNLTPPWPEDEYLLDGGDRDTPVRVGRDWSVDGLHTEDTILHYDTLDGDTHVEPSNRVAIYAPRFAAVRKVYGIVQHEHRQFTAGVNQELQMQRVDDVNIATTMTQPVQLSRDVSLKSAASFQEELPSRLVDNIVEPVSAHGSLLPFEDFTIIRTGQYDSSEKARLAERIQAAVAWSHDTALQVVINGVPASEARGAVNVEQTVTYVLPEGKSRMRIVKIASKQNALPGDLIEFTLRFDNVGDQVVGNVTIVDNLTTRLEYVDGSQQCSLQADFLNAENQGESLMLRWEVTDPIPVGEGGIIRFQCRVR